MWIDSLAIFHLHRDSLRADGQDKVNLGFGGTFREVGQVKVRHTGQEIADNTLSQVSCQIGQVGLLPELCGVQGHDLLEPARPQAVVAQAELAVSLPPFQSNLERTNQPQQKGPLEES